MGIFQDDDCCFDCTRISLIILNTIFCIVGVASIAVGISMVFKAEWFMSFVHIDGIDYIEPDVSLKNLNIAGYVLCAFGALLFIFMLLGLFGSSYSNQCLLGSYVTCLIVILIVKIGMSVFIYLEWRQYEDSVEKNLRSWIVTEFELHEKKVREIQTNNSCCGFDGPKDYDTTPLRREGCPRMLGLDTIVETGCREAILGSLELKLIIAGAIGLGVALFEILGVALANVLVCSLRSDVYYYD